MPVYNGAATVDRAIQSVCEQAFGDWELIAVDDASSDNSRNVVAHWVAADSRVRTVALEENQGVSAARNAAIRAARGRFIVYLDQDDEFYSDYLTNVARNAEKGDVLMFGYDFVYEDGPAGDRLSSWEPASVKSLLFCQNIATPLGVAHRREMWERVGGFNEAWCEGDSDLWRRMARVGGQFIFLPLKSGRYHVRGDSASRVPHLTKRQRATFLANWHAGKPLYSTSVKTANKLANKRIHKIAFVSPHCVVDFTNGAAVATRDALAFLGEQGFHCEAFCGTRFDAWEESLVEEVLSQQKIRYEVRNALVGRHQARMIFTQQGKVPVTLFNSASTRGGWLDVKEAAGFLTACEIFLARNRPDVVWTYGGDPVSCAIHKLVKQLDIPLCFALHNFAYDDVEVFRSVDFVTVPSEFSRRHYWNKLGLDCRVLPNIVNWKAAEIPKREPRFVTFINPQGLKGVYVFARIATELGRRRPDIPLLVTQGRSRQNALNDPELGLELRIRGELGEIDVRSTGSKAAEGRNITILPFTPDPMEFYSKVYSVTRLLLMPSLWEESFGLVSVEAMLNGIPVLASNRGALPETIGDGGLLFDIPARYTPETRELPSVEEVEPWVKTIIRLWDDTAWYEQRSAAALERAQFWHPDRLAQVYRSFFGGITHQPGPPLVPREFDKAKAE